MKYPMLFFYLVILFGCDQQVIEQYSKSSKDQAERVSMPRKVAPKNSIPPQKTNFLEAQRIYDLFPATKVLKIQETDQYVIGSVDGLVIVGPWIYIYDKIGRAIYKLDRQGKIMGQVGRRGKGPGEYEYPLMVRRIWGDQLSVLDAAGRLLVYDREGNFVFSYSLAQNQIVPRGAYAWDFPHRLFAGDYTNNGLYMDEPYIAVIDTTRPREPAQIGGMLERYDFEKMGVTHYAFKALTVLEDRVWVAYPFECRIHVFDLDGNPLETIDLARPNGMTLESYREIVTTKKPADQERALHARERLNEMKRVGDHVLVRLSYTLLLLNAEGDIVSRPLPMEVGNLLAVHDNMLITRVPLGTEKLRQHLPEVVPETYRLMAEQGFNVEDDTDDIWLRFGTLGHEE